MQTDPEKIHVLHIPRWYPHRNDPMLGLFAKNHIESLKGKCSNSVIYIHFCEQQSPAIEIEQRLEIDVLTCIAYIRKQNYNFSLINYIRNAFRYFKAFRQCYKIIANQTGKPDLCHVHVLTRPAVAALWLKWTRGIPYIVSEHWSRYFSEHNDFRGVFRRFFTKLSLKKSNALICVSGKLHKAMQSHGLDHPNYFTVPNVVDTELFKPASNKPVSEKLQLIHISCFEDRSKNISGLLKAMQMLKLNNQAVFLDLVGDGIDKPEMEHLASSLDLNEDNIAFHGLLEPVDLVKRLQAADFLVQTSLYETFSTVVAESFSCGVPVISTPVGIFPEVCEPGTGLTIPSPGYEDIARTIESAIQKKDAFDPVRMRKIAVDSFSKENVGNILHGIYLSILKKIKP